jgi:lycopene cyclase domain-containing protein
MPEYTLAAIVFLAVGAVAAAAVGLLRRRSTWLTLGVFAGFTVVFDVILTGLPIVTYGDGFTTGIALGPMPIEDLLYGLALALAAMVGSTAAGRWWRR